MNILIAVASRHGSTREIAEALAGELRTAGQTVDVQNAEQAADVERYDAVIVGSAVYMGSWLAEARQFVEQNRAKLLAIPVWLFSSGPVGRDDPKPKGDPEHLDDLMQATGARDHRIFVGKLDKSRLGLSERVLAAMIKAPEGDFRDWAEIDAWADSIAHDLAAESVAAGSEAARQ